MQYVNFVYDDGDTPELHSGPVDEDDAAYLRRVAAELKPLSEDEYVNGPAAILSTLAKSSYVLDGTTLYWCAEWEPGFVVVSFVPGGQMSWVAVRSPVPGFGGREETDADWDAYDEDAENPQYNLIFPPWDAQFDADDRESGGFVPADDDVRSRFEAALARANELTTIVEERAKDEGWSERCQQNLATWCGEGLRL